MSEPIFCDTEKTAHDALGIAQFGFSLKPCSTNNHKIPIIRYTSERKPYPCQVLSSEATTFKTNLYNIASMQKKRIGWETFQRTYSFWVILRADNKQMEALDVNNVDKIILDEFVKAGILPDDKHCRDCRQMYGNFREANVPDNFLFCVLIRWDKPIGGGLL